ncbi:MAG: YihA family ribosome biogenesis GTP-binding protein [Myxococcales bacterium]|nr:YihA family ribosome biogenesis GTP-binding protein [Myxococcales bacterium]
MRPRAARFVTSATRPVEFPVADLPEIAFAGRSNVGKSSLLNMLAGVSGLARTSRTPGRTRLLNWFHVALPRATGGHDACYFVDLPGYGFASVDRGMRASWRPLMESYLGERTTLKVVVLLIDIRRGVEDDERDFVPWLLQRDLSVVTVLTKADKLGKAKRQPIVASVKAELGLPRAPVLFSSLERLGNDELWRALLAGLARG